MKISASRSQRGASLSILLVLSSSNLMLASHVLFVRPANGTSGIVCAAVDPIEESVGFSGTVLKQFGSTLFYSVDPVNIPSNLSPEELNAAVDAAFSSWQSASGGVLTFARVAWTPQSSCSSDRVIRLTWLDNNVILQASTNGATFITYDRATGEIIGATIAFNLGSHFLFAREWRTDGGRAGDPQHEAVDVQSTAVHEIGHALGLGHSDYVDDPATGVPSLVSSPPAVMKRFDNTRRTPTADDIDGLNYLYPPVGPITTFGTVAVRAKFNGNAWLGSLSYYVTCPFRVVIGLAVPGTTANVPTGQCTLTYNSGGPSTILPPVIVPSSSQVLGPNQTITFELDFRSGNQAPTAGFAMTSQSQTETDGNVALNLTVQPGQAAAVQFDATTRSQDPGGVLSYWSWAVDGIPVTLIRGPQPAFTQSLAVGTHTISLVVADNWGMQSSAVYGTVVVGMSSTAQFLSFVEGNPGVPGDGIVVSSPLTRNFTPSPLTSLASVTDGLTLSAFPVGGLPNIIGFSSGIVATNAAPGCQGIETSFGTTLGVFPSGTVTFNGVEGLYTYIPQTFLDSLVASQNVSHPSCQFTLSQFSLDSLFLPNATGGVTTMDGASFGPGPASFPSGVSLTTTGIIVVGVSAAPTATFTIAGPTAFSGIPVTGGFATFPDALPGAYTITFGAVPGYVTPPQQTLTLASGGVITFLGNYSPSANWTQKFPLATPGMRQGHSMAYDEVRSQVVLFGGSSGNQYLNDTWTWDGTNWTANTVSTPPPVRGHFSMVYDRARAQIVLFGGFNGSFDLGDTWTWDGTNWTQRFPTSSPGSRRSPALAYDPVSQRVVLFGGGGVCGNPCADTWTWDGTNWTRKTPSMSPPGREEHAMTYDSNLGRVLLFGGVAYISAPQTFFNDTWTWDGTNWTQQSTTSAPSARSDHVMSYDPSRHEIVLFGGFSPPNSPSTAYALNDTWVWDGNTWSQIRSSIQPDSRLSSGLVYDAMHGQLTLFGGGSGGPSQFGDTWVY